jgi:hypothetical protein
MKRIGLISFVTIAALTLVLCAVLFVSCSKDEDSSSDSPCEIIKVSNTDISVTHPEASCDMETWEPHFNEHGQVTSLEFTLSCESKTYSGRIFNISYNEVGDISSYDATVNGQSCQ